MVTIPVEYRDVTGKELEGDSGLENNRPYLPGVSANSVSVHGPSVVLLISSAPDAPGPSGLDDTEFTNILIELNWQ